MKKFITLLIAAGAFGTVLAQTDSRSEEARRVILGERKTSPSQNPRDVVIGNEDRRVYDENGNRYPGSSREAEIDRINRDYDLKVQSIRNNPHLTQAEKERIIRRLNNERAERIKQVNNDYRRYEEDRRYDDRRNNDSRRYDDNDDNYKKNKKYKKNNGKHLGWEKGRGNPHRGRN